MTVAFLLERNPSCKFIFTYQERSSDWCLENLLRKWELNIAQISLDNLESHSSDLFNGGSNHTIHLFEITAK